MKCAWLVLAGMLAASPSAAQGAKPSNVIPEVRAAIAAGDFDRAEAIYTKRRAEDGLRPEVVEALSWLGRGALAAGQLDRAEGYARDAHRLALEALGGRKLDSEPRLAIALGAGIEVQAQVRGRRGERTDAVYFLQRELATYKDTSLYKRIQKNINLLSLEGRPAPPLDLSEFVGAAPPPLDQLKGKVLVLFFWAHWCPDCKMQGPILSKLLAKYQSQGLVVVAPTQRYGYVARGASASPEEELRYILQIRDTHYDFLHSVPMPVTESNHKLYGVSTTPTLVIVDRKGIVRLYHPGQMTEQALEAQIRGLLAPPDTAARR